MTIHEAPTNEQSGITLAATWNPRGELPRFERLLTLLKDVYASIALSFPPISDPTLTDLFTKGVFATDPFLVFVVNQEWAHGRYMALKLALETQSD